MTSTFFGFFHSPTTVPFEALAFEENPLPVRRHPRRAKPKEDVDCVALPPEPEVPAVPTRRAGTLKLAAPREVVATTTTQSVDVIQMISRFKTRDERAAKAAANLAADKAADEAEFAPFLEPVRKRKGPSKAQKQAKAAQHAKRREANPPPAKGERGSILERRGVMLKVPKHVTDMTLKGK